MNLIIQQIIGLLGKLMQAIVIHYVKKTKYKVLAWYSSNY